MARFSADARQAVVVCNSEGSEKTPSIVYFGETETLVGDPAAHVLADSGGDRETAARVIRSVKRNLVSPPRIALPGGRTVRPTEVAAQILGKLRQDADERNGNGATERAVITCPAVFDAPQQQAIVDAAQQAGFCEVELVEEPRAAALAFEHAGGTIGKGVLVYDFGGGTFDAAFVVREEGENRFYLALEPDGDPNCGGDDIDQALYDFFDRQAREELGRPISGDDGAVDVAFLRTCRRRKESLSKSRHATFSTLLSGGVAFRSSIDRETFEGLIAPIVERTIRITQQVARRASEAGYPVDTVLLVGGSSQVPLVERRITETLEQTPQTWGHRDLAVALGAAYHAASLWDAQTAPAKRLEPAERYREAVKLVWSDGRLDPAEAARLKVLAAELALAPAEAARIEREVIGRSKEELLGHAQPPPTQAESAPRAPARPRDAKRGPGRAIAAAVAAVVLVAGGVGAVVFTSGPDPPAPIDPAGNNSSSKGSSASSNPDAPPVDPVAPSSDEDEPSDSGSYDPARGEALNDKGFTLMDAGRYDAAIPKLQEAVNSFPPGTDDLTYGYALYNLGRSLRLAGRPDEAIPVLEERLLIPDQPAAVSRELELARQQAGQG